MIVEVIIVVRKEGEEGESLPSLEAVAFVGKGGGRVINRIGG